MFTSDERKQLESFCKVCDDIAKCRFIRDFSKQSHRVFIGKLPDGRIMDEYPRYDEDDFRSLMTHYRKLRLNQEPTYLFTIMKLLKRKGDPSDLPMFKHFKKEIKEEERSWWCVTLCNPNGDDELLTQGHLEDLILNGEVIHVHQDEKDKLALVTGRSGLMKTVALSNFIRFVLVVIHRAQKTAETIRYRGYLSSTSPNA